MKTEASTKERAARFRALHERSGAFIIPNPWDVGSARLLSALGFEALATTSSGFANSLGRADGSVTFEEKLEHCRALCAGTTLPVSADLENGYGNAPEHAAEAITRVAETGVVGGSIEDYSRDEHRLYDFEHAVERVAAAAAAARALPFPFTLTARAENLLRGRNDLDDTIRRLQAFEAAGADVLYAPALKTLEDVQTVTSSLSNPVNVLGPMVEGATRDALAAAGATRISIGGALARAAWAPVLRASEEMLEHGSFGWRSELAASARLDALFGG